MTPFFRKLLGLNWLLLANMLALAIFGVVAIYSATYMREDSAAAEVVVDVDALYPPDVAVAPVRPFVREHELRLESEYGYYS